MRKQTLDEIKSLDINRKGWDKQLIDILKKDNLENAWYPISQSLLESGTDIKDNDYLYIINMLPNEAIKAQDSAYYLVLYNLVKGKQLKDTDRWLFEPSLYNESSKDNLYKVKVLTFIKDKHNLRKFGNAADMNINKMKDQAGNYLTADQMKDVLSKWQSKSGDEDDDYTLLDFIEANGKTKKQAYQFLRDIVKQSSLTNSQKEKLSARISDIFRDGNPNDLLYTEIDNNKTEPDDIVQVIRDYMSSTKGPAAKRQTQGTIRGWDIVKKKLHANLLSPKLIATYIDKITQPEQVKKFIDNGRQIYVNTIAQASPDYINSIFKSALDKKYNLASDMEGITPETQLNTELANIINSRIKLNP